MATNHWANLVLNAASIRAIYGSEVPSLSNIALHEITLHRDGPRVLLRLDLPEYPVHPPTKWIAAGFNRVQLQLSGVGVSKLQIDGLESDMRLDLQIDACDGNFRLRARNDAFGMDFEAQAVSIEKIAAYRDEEELD